MANIKRIFLDWSETGITVYCIIRREVDDYRLDDADGNFAAAPADPYLSLVEDAVIKGRYEIDESRITWDDGRYTFTFYKQAGGSPVPASDTVIGTGELYIESDTEVVQTGDSFLRLGTPAGTSVSEDIADTALEANVELHVANAINNTIPLHVRSDGTLVADGTEQTIYEVTPTVTLVPDSITMSMSNMASGDSTIIRMYAKLKSGGAYELIDSKTYRNAKDIPAINITGQPNRYGWKVTLQQTEGTNRSYDWERYTLTT